MARTGRPVPQVFRRGQMGYYAANLRRWGGGRPTLRDPHAPGWPKRGDHTDREDEAVRWALVYVDRLVERKYRKRTGKPEESLRLEEAVLRFKRAREHKVEQNTREADATALNHMITYLGGDRLVERIGADELQAWFDARLAQDYKASTLVRYRGSLSKFFKWAKLPNIAAEVELPNPEQGEARAWSDVELEIIRAAASEVGEQHRLFLELGLATGGRVAELLALEWGDFDALHRTVRFRRQLVSETTFRTKGLKGDKNRSALVLPEWWDFHTPSGKGRIVRLRTPMRAILDKAGMREPEILNHAMRHSYARICRERYHIPISVLMVYMGHSTERITEQFYGWMGRDVALDYGHSLVYENA